MKTQRRSSGTQLLNRCTFLLPLLITWGGSIAQVGNLNTKTPIISSLHAATGNDADLFGTRTRYIENIGQYGDTLSKYSNMGNILYGYEGLNMPVLFTSKGVIYLQRKTIKASNEELHKLRSDGKPTTINRTITMEWLNANPDPRIVAEDICHDHFSYGLLRTKARTYKKIVYKELYPGIDLVYSFTDNKKAGFEYSLQVNPGADISRVKMKYGGDVKNITQDKYGNLIIASGIDEISVSTAECYYTDNNSQKFLSPFKINNNTINFTLPSNYNKQKTLVIDPFVSGTATLSGTDAGKAKDIDFDYSGNIYTVGGGDGTVQMLSKYNASGGLEWTFNGSLGIPCWEFGGSRGGWTVDKINSKIYLGQGLQEAGFRVIRLDAEGLYDNYMTNADRDYTQNWKMAWTCNGGSPEIYIAGEASTGQEPTSNIQLFRLSPSSNTISPIHLTEINTSNTDISDLVIDPVSNQLYSIFSTSILDPSLNNKIYKHLPPYALENVAWSNSTGSNALKVPVNRPYLSGIDNSSNTIAINSTHLFYWDGKNLRAFSKSDGQPTCSPLSVSGNQLLMQGGIVADDCNNVFVGSRNGTIKVYHFTGTSFEDDAAADITVSGFSSSSVYDLINDKDRGLLYACGDGFVASIDISRYCAVPVYSVNVTTGCSLSANASISPAPPTGSVVTYNLFNGTTLVATNTTGHFTGLTAGVNYTIVAMPNQVCGGAQAIAYFTVVAPPVLKISNPPAICADNTTDLSLASITAGSTSGLVFTYWSDAAATIPCLNSSNVKPGTYYIKGTISSGCSVVAPVTVTTLPAPKANAGPDMTICFGNNGQLNGSGGSTYYWSPSTNLSNARIANPIVTNPGAGTMIYHLKVKDALGCTSVADDEVKISFALPAKISITSDTVVSINQPLQLNAIDINNSGFTDFTWTPSYGLNNPFIANPVVIADKDITYTLHAGTVNHCTDDVQVRIKVFRGPDIYVPNSFTPNGDGINDLLKPVPVGVREFHYFNVFNRFGQLLFSTTNASQGWDGKIQGKEQVNGTYVWIAEAVDYKGNIIQQKGYSTLIR